LGFVPEQDKADLIAGAAALVQPSVNESLSLAALEAWQAGVPVIGRAGCAAIEGHLQRCDGGRSVDSYEQFRNALDDLGQNSEAWKQRGAKGREYVAGHYSSADAL